MTARALPPEGTPGSPVGYLSSIQRVAVDRIAVDDREKLVALAAGFNLQQNPSAAHLCLLRASQLGEPGLGRQLASHYHAARALREIEVDGDSACNEIKGLVSIVMPTRGTSGRIRESIQSVVEQTYHSWELIIVNDGGSETRLREILRQFEGARIRYIHKSKNCGPSAARNAGIAAATGEWIAYLDDDDAFLPHHLAACVNALRKTGAGFAFSRCNRVFGRWVDDRFEEETRQTQAWPSKKPTVDHLLRYNFICTLNVLHLRRAMKLTGGWDPGIRHLEDWELWIRLATRVGIVSVPHVTGLYRIVRDPSRSANASVVQAEQMVLFEGLISAMLADGRGFHRVLIDCLDAGHWEQAQCAFECLCSSAAAYPIGNLDVIRSQYLALRRGIKAGLSYKEVRMALARLVQRRLVLNLAELHRQVRKSIDRYISWRIRRFL